MANTPEILNAANVALVLNPPEFSGYQAVAQSIGINVWTSLNIDTTNYDNYGGHSNVTNNNRYTAQVPGWYTVSGVYTAAGNNTGFRAVRIQKNGNPILGHASYSCTPTVSGIGIITPTKDVQLNVGDWVEVQGWQNTSGNLNTDIAIDQRPGLWVRFSHI
jgi:hypothetical protein